MCRLAAGALALALVGGLWAGGCGEAAPTPEPGVARRIVAMAPNVTEILFALELGDRVVGVGDYATWPPEVASIPKLGGLYDVSLERILELEPDLAILIPSEAELAGHLRRLGIEVLEVENESLDQVETSIEAIPGPKASARDNIAFFPLAIPMLAGPGAIATIMLVMGPRYADD